MAIPADFPLEAVEKALQKELEKGHERFAEDAHRDIIEGLERNLDAMARLVSPRNDDYHRLMEKLSAKARQSDIDEVDFDVAVNEAEDEALRDINVWQSFNPEGDDYETLPRIGHGVRHYSYEYEQDFLVEVPFKDIPELERWLDNASDDDYSWFFDGEFADEIELEGGKVREVRLRRIDIVGWYFEEVEPTVYIPKFLEVLQGLIEEKLPVLGMSEAEFAERLRLEAAATEEVADLSGGPARIRPYKLYNLTKRAQLEAESRDMRHCVGRKDMGYYEHIKRGDIAIWSLRTHAGKRKLTFEVELDGSGTPIRILQIKGKPNNRLPGFDVGSRDLSKPEEVLMLVDLINYLDSIHVLYAGSERVEEVPDLRPALREMGLLPSEEREASPNPRVSRRRMRTPTFRRRTFDTPWTPPRGGYGRRVLHDVD